MTHPFAERLLILFFFFSFLHSTSISQKFRLVKDINTETDGIPDIFRYATSRYSYNYSNTFPVLNGVAYFSADDGIHGRGLWRSDGSNAGTYQLKESINPQSIIACNNNKLFFTTLGSATLWVTDGTIGGRTDSLFDGTSSVSNPNPIDLINFNGTAFFVVNNRSNRDQLWKSDGTTAGTVLIKDFYDSTIQNGRLANFAVIKNKLYFSVESLYPNLSSRSHLWVTNGDAAGTYLISDKVFNPAQIIPGSSDPFDDLVYFSATNSPGGPRSLYITNGNRGVVTAVTGFNGIISNDNNVPIIKRENIIYFIGRENASMQNQSLYKFDLNNANGVQLVKSVTGKGPRGSSKITDLVELDGKLIFSLFDAVNDKYQLWKSDGSVSGNIILRDSVQPFYFTRVNGTLFFTGISKSTGTEFWKTDGTVSGTELVKDIHPGVKSSSPNCLTYFNNKILFSASHPVYGTELWQSDGTSGGTSLLKDINQNATSSSFAYSLTEANNKLFFLASEGNGESNKFWKTDGTNSGTAVLNDSIYQSGTQQGQVVLNNEIYFWGTSLSGKSGIYKSNGSAAAAVLLRDFTSTASSSTVVAKTDDLVYFTLRNKITFRYELWRTDGTTANTYIVKSEDVSSYYGVTPFVSTGKNLFFAVYDYTGSKLLWKTDGTVAGTVLLNNLISPDNLVAHKGVLYFRGYDGSYSLWKSDGTPSGTVKVTPAVSSPSNFISSNGELFFIASPNTSNNIGNELYKTDGTENGTVLVKDIHPGSSSTNVYLNKNVNGVLYLLVNGTDFNHTTLWRSDGSAEGTQFISNVGNGTGRTPYKVVSGNGKLFFVLDGSIWESDGTGNGTHTIYDNVLSNLSFDEYNSNLVVVGSQLFITASEYKYGHELYVGRINNGVIAEYVTAANGNWNDPATWLGNVVPPAGVNVLILHNVAANMDATCNELRVEAPGGLTVNDGVRITLLQ